MGLDLLGKIKRHLPFIAKLSALYSLTRGYSFLVESGWFLSVCEGVPVDRHGSPIPWMPYSFIEFIKGRLKKSHKIFEYGCGYSTLFFAARVELVSSVEHNKKWSVEITRLLPNNAKIVHLPLSSGKYFAAIEEISYEADIVVVDGPERVECVNFILKSNKLSEGGVVLIDDSERNDEYNDAYLALSKNGYKRLDFWDVSPITSRTKCTSVFYKENNVLEL